MKKIKKERIEYDYKYIAVDGTEFENENECQTYEQSAFGVLRGRVTKMALTHSDACTIFDGEGCEEHTAFVVAPKNDDEVKTIQQLLYMRVYGEADQKEQVANKIEIGKPVVIIFDYDDEYCWVSDLASIVANATAGKFKVVAAE